MNRFATFFRWLSAGNALADRTGKQDSTPSSALVSDAALVGPDVALQISTVWACIDRRA